MRANKAKNKSVQEICFWRWKKLEKRGPTPLEKQLFGKPHSKKALSEKTAFANCTMQVLPPE